MAAQQHIPVMTDEIIAGLKIKPSGVYIDATFGRGGHSMAILQQLAEEGRIIAIDKDPAAVAIARQLQTTDPRITIYHGSFARIMEFCVAEDLVGKVDGIVLDLGVSSPQLDEAARGFSFMQDGPLDMRMDPTVGQSAAAWLASATATEIVAVLKNYGEEKYAKLLAKAIIRAQSSEPIVTTKRLADIITNVYPKKYTLTKHPATKSFQAIRIFINNELEDLQQVLAPIVKILTTTGRLAIISFHSLEDRIVKQFINHEAKGDKYPARFAIRASELDPTLKKIGKPQRATDFETASNGRSRSAILRIAEKLAPRQVNHAI